MRNARESAVKLLRRLAVSKPNPGVFEAAKRWGSCLTASLRQSPALIIFISALLCAAVLPLFVHGAAPPAPQPNTSPEWAEARWLPADAAPVRRPLTALEESFASRFPGRIARFSDGRHVWIVRVMDRPTRMLHPAADCFRGLGYSVQPPRVHLDAQERSWRCFAAEKNGRRLKVCERIFDRKDGHWTDTSSWYWSALLGRESGPWWAVTQVEEGREG